MVGIKSLYLLLIIGLLHSCKREANFNALNFEEENRKLFVGIKGQTETLPISADRYKVLDDSLNYLYINHNNDILYYANLDKENPHLESFLLKEELLKVDNYGKISSFDFSVDSIFTVKQDHRIAVIDLKEEAIIFSLNATVNDSADFAFVDYHIPITYSVGSKKLYSQVVFNSQVEKEFPYDVRFHIEIDTKTSQMKPIPVKYPRSYGHGEYGHLSFMKNAHSRDRIFYTSSSETYITVYEKGTTRNIPLSTRDRRTVSSISKDSLWDSDLNGANALRSFYYEDILFDSTNELLYRVFALKLKAKNLDGLYHTIKDKEKGVVLAHKEKKVGEFMLSEKGVLSYGVGPKGFYFRSEKIEVTNDSIFQYYKLVKPPTFN